MRHLEVLRSVRLSCHLAAATAEWIVEDAQADGNRAFDESGPEPAGDDLHNRIARAQYRQRERQARLDWERDTTPDPDAAAATALAFAALRAGQQP